MTNFILHQVRYERLHRIILTHQFFFVVSLPDLLDPLLRPSRYAFFQTTVRILKGILRLCGLEKLKRT